MFENHIKSIISDNNDKNHKIFKTLGVNFFFLDNGIVSHKLKQNQDSRIFLFPGTCKVACSSILRDYFYLISPIILFNWLVAARVE